VQVWTQEKVVDREQRRPLEILLVEDNETDVVLARAALLDSHIVHELRVVTDGEAALAFLRRKGKYSGAKRPDIVLLDLRLPKVDGHGVLAEMRSDAALKGIPVIILTGMPHDREAQKSYELGAAKYLVKPVAIKEYLAIIRAIQEFCRPRKGSEPESHARPH
jgi:DNA-binding response OmpR family regulator